MKGTSGGMDDLPGRALFVQSDDYAWTERNSALYIHSLLATPNDYEGVIETGRARSMDRKYTNEEIESLLEIRIAFAMV